MKNLILYALGGVTVFGGYLFLKKKSHPALAAATTATAALPSAGTKETSTANNSTGSINYTAVSNLAGFNVPVRQVVVPRAAPGTVTYPPATTVTDPKNMSGTVINYQNAAPIPSNFYYYPADGDLWGIVSARLGGTPAIRITDPKNNSQIPLTSVPSADVGKLNGIVSYKDFDLWMKAKKPLRLPVGGWNDVAGKVPGATGDIK